MDEDSNEELLYHLATFEPADAKRMLEVLDAHDIPFTVEGNHSALLTPGRWFQQYMAMSPEGSKVEVFVTEEYLEEATRLYHEQFNYEV